MDGGAWWATARGVAKRQTRLGDFTFTSCAIVTTVIRSTHFIVPTAFIVPAFVRASPIAQLVKSPPAMKETPVWFLGQEDPLKKG